MPVAPAVIAALIGAATTVGETVYQAVSAPGQPKAAPTGPPKPAGLTPAQITSAAAPYASNIQALTGGSLSPDYFAQNAGLQAGVLGQPNSQGALQKLAQQIFGSQGTTPAAPAQNTASETFHPSGEPTNTAAAFTASPGVSDFMQKVAAELT